MKLIKLFEPLKIQELEIKNRIVMPALGLGYTPKGEVTDVFSNFYEKRAKGGAGLIIIGGLGINPNSGGTPYIGDDKFIPGYTAFAEKMHKHGAKVMAQIMHQGAYYPSPNAVSASAVRSNLTRMVPKELTIEEIKQIQEDHALAAERLLEAGFDGVELLGSAGYLITQFLSPVINKRTDEYGGSLENRLRYPIELIKLMKKRVGGKMIVGMRVAGDDFVPGSNDWTQSPIFSKSYEEAGIEFLNVTGGWHETRIPQIPMMVPQAAYVYLGENIKNEVNVPVFMANRINDPLIAEQILRDERVDAISMGRGLIADPELPNKAKENRLWDIMKCVACNQGCFDTIFSGKSVVCMRNYMTAKEGDIDLTKKTNNPQKVLVIGSGPGGLETARIAAVLGHDVTIVEKSESIGGQMKSAAVPHSRRNISEMLSYYKAQIRHRHIKLRLATEATPEFINELNPDAVIFATGVKLSTPDIPGIDGSNGSDICYADEALAGDHVVGKNVVVVGGGATGLETAIWAAELGAINSDIAHFLSFYELIPQEEIIKRWLKGNRKVTIIDVLPRLATNVGRTTRGYLIGISRKLQIDSIMNAEITKFEGNSMQYKVKVSDQEEETHTMDNINTFILATGVKSNTDLYEKVKATNPSYKMFNIGDSKEPRTMMEAIHEGFETAYNLDK
ncbi:MAG: oxidoreductase [Promethearchaeota archaeon]|jgi:2,4-dienoyl-CoA reductase (NADPH2)